MSRSDCSSVCGTRMGEMFARDKKNAFITSERRQVRRRRRTGKMMIAMTRQSRDQRHLSLRVMCDTMSGGVMPRSVCISSLHYARHPLPVGRINLPKSYSHLFHTHKRTVHLWRSLLLLQIWLDQIWARPNNIVASSSRLLSSRSAERLVQVLLLPRSISPSLALCFR